MCKFLIAALAASFAAAQAPAVLEQISSRLTANGLKADVAFLASDSLQGRGTPSPGLDAAAEFVAAQFRRAGLEPGGDDGYFQTADFAQVAPVMDGLEVSVESGGQTVKAAPGLAIMQAAAADISGAPTVKVAPGAPLPPAETLQGKVVVVEAVRGPAFAAVLAAKPALVLLLPAGGMRATGRGPTQLREAGPAIATVPIVVVANDAALAKALASPDAKVTAHVPAPKVNPVKLRNVIGVLRGSDPVLKDSYIIFTAHYDHLGVRENGQGTDHIFNGANDDASGTASVMEIATALASLPQRPKRTIVFMTLFGEEVGELGSQYYARHPMFPLAKTIADVNLEQLGRTDEVGEGTKLNQFNLTGFDYTDLPAVFQRAGKQTGVKVVKDEQKSDSYFGRSDNAAFANVGVPSTTLSVTYAYGDYHAAGDEWPKLDYENMAKVDRTIALAALDLADGTYVPKWNEANAKTEGYRKARAGK